MSSQRARGIAIALVGVLAVSPDAMLLRWMRSLGASSPDVATAKYAGIIACMILIGYHHGLRSPNQSMPHFLASAFSQLLYQLAFTFCLLLTDAAKALLLISLAPLWAALFGYFALGEKLPRRTLIALGVCMCGVLLVFAPRLLGVSGDADGSADDNDEGDAVAFAIPYSQLLSKDVPIPRVYDSLAGDSLAIATGIAQGLSLTVSRHAAIHKPGCELTLATALSSLVAAMVAMELPCYDISVQQASAEATFWACTPPVAHAELRLARPVRRIGGRNLLRLDAPRAQVHYRRGGCAGDAAGGDTRTSLGACEIWRRALALDGSRRRCAAQHSCLARVPRPEAWL